MAFHDILFDTYLPEFEKTVDSFGFLEEVTIDVENGSVLVEGKQI